MKIPGRNAKSGRRKRRYRSAVREEQAERTRERVLDAIMALIQGGDRELSYAALAREAQVSLPTIYRHFPSREALYRAFTDREAGRSQQHQVAPSNREEMEQAARQFYQRFDDPRDPIRHGRINEIWALSRVGSVPRRRAAFEALFDREAPGVPEPARSQLVDLTVVLVSSAMGEAFRGYLGLSGSQMAERAMLAIDALFGHARALAAAGGGRGRRGRS